MCRERRMYFNNINVYFVLLMVLAFAFLVIPPWKAPPKSGAMETVSGEKVLEKWQAWASGNCYGRFNIMMCELAGRRIYVACDDKEGASLCHLKDDNIEIFAKGIFSSIEFFDDKFIGADCIKWVDGEPVKTDISEILEAH